MTKFIFKSIFVFLTVLFFAQSFVFAKPNNNFSPYKILADNNGVYVIEIVDEYKKKEKQQFLQPYVVEELKTNEEVYKETDASLVVNAGFFDPKNQKTVSYVVSSSAK